MSIIRITKQKNFSIISNQPLNDPNLSMKARGIWATLLSKPDDWTVYVYQLVKTCKDGKTSIYSGLKELKEAGYLEHVFIRDEGGKMVRGEYIVHEEPIDVETTVKPESEPYTENRDTVNRNTDNRPLLKTNNKLKTDDDVQIQLPEPNSMQEPEKNPSSSFSKSELITVLATLMALIPKQHQKPSIEKTIERGLKAYSEDYIQAAITYTITNSNGGTWQKFKAYLGKCIDNGWADGWEPDSDQGDQIDKEAIQEKFRKIPDNDLKVFAETGNVWAIEELECRKL